jgi:hypothetical protein
MIVPVDGRYHASLLSLNLYGCELDQLLRDECDLTPSFLLHCPLPRRSCLHDMMVHTSVQVSQS